MHTSVYEYASRFVIKPELITGRHVIEAGSSDYNGSLRPQIEALMPASYVGVDLEDGPRVDVECAFENYRPEREYDLTICTEVMEHVEQIHPFIHALKAATRVGGLLLVTTRSPGFPLHGFPEDYWRYTQADMRALFADLEILSLCDDWKPEHPGVFMLALRTGPVEQVFHQPHRVDVPEEVGDVPDHVPVRDQQPAVDPAG